MNSNPLGYLLKTKLKNIIKNLFRKPSRVILLVIFAAMFAITIFGGASGNSESGKAFRDIGELKAGISVLLILIFTTSFLSTYKSGGSVFSMSDVTLIFPSPLDKKSVLFYGLVQQMGTSLFIGFFLLFQYTILHVTYNLSIWGLLLIFLVYSLTAFLAQSCAMFLYTFTSDSDKKPRLVKAVFLFYIAVLLAYLGFSYLQNPGTPLQTLVAAVNSLPIMLFPFGGWLSAFAGCILTGSYLSAALWLTLTVAAFFVFLALVSHSKREYYEDVLASAETRYTAISSAREGNVPEAPRNIKLGKTGLNSGVGAVAIFRKHLLESRRSSSFLISGMSLGFAVMTIAFAFFLRKAGIIGIFAFAAYMQMFSISGGRFFRELTLPYIYLIPEPPLKKLIFSLLEIFPMSLTESIIIFVPVCLILGASALECVACILARLSFSAIFVCGEVVVDRIWGGSLSKVAGVVLYMLVDIILLLPGIVLGAVLSFSGVLPLATSLIVFLSMTICNLPISVLTLLICKNMIQYAEI
ncbi:MAG: putative ABC exporter domain-containing protein [Oscillospiraceae bacterium]